MDRPIAAGSAATAQGEPLDSETPGAITQLTYSAGALPALVTSRSDSSTVTGFALSGSLVRGPSIGAPGRFAGSFTISTARGLLTGSFEGEARRLNGAWEVRGQVVWSGGSWNVASGTGGLSAQLDAALSFRADGVTTGQIG
jgi:hypothetical protein